MNPLNCDQLTTTQLTKVLNLSKTEVRRLLKEKHLAISETYQTEYGHGYRFSRDKIEVLKTRLPEIMAGWERQRKLHAEEGKIKSVETRKRNREHIELVKKEKQRYLEEIGLYEKPISELFRICFYLFNLSSYISIKNNHTQSLSGITELMELKRETLRVIMGNHAAFECISASVLDGGHKRRVLIRLCDSCKSRTDKLGLSQEQGLFGRMQDYIHINCQQCLSEPGIKHFYSLIEITISKDSHKFIFHVPYLNAAGWFKDITSLQTKVKKERHVEEGCFRGNKISSLERRATPLSEIKKEIFKFLNNNERKVSRVA